MQVEVEDNSTGKVSKFTFLVKRRKIIFALH